MIHILQKTAYHYQKKGFDQKCKEFVKKFGDAGYRSRYLSHAKRALYHLSYTPVVECVLNKLYEVINL